MAHGIIVSPQSQLDLDLGLDLGLRGPDLGLGHDNKNLVVNNILQAHSNQPEKLKAKSELDNTWSCFHQCPRLCWCYSMYQYVSLSQH